MSSVGESTQKAYNASNLIFPHYKGFLQKEEEKLLPSCELNVCSQPPGALI